MSIMKIREAQNFSDMIIDALFDEAQKNGISSYKIAKMCEISEASLSYIKHHKTRPTIYTVKLIADAIGVNLSDCVKMAEINSNKKNK